MASFAELLAQQEPRYLLALGGNDQAQFETHQLNQGLNFGKNVSQMTPEERAFMAELAPKGEAADARVVEEMDRLRARGDDLANVDEAYMNRAFRPAFERLMESYQLADRQILDDLNRRGISSQGSSADNGSGAVESTPESHARALLARDTKNQISRTMLEAQNQAVQQKLAQYQGRLAETNQANTRFGQVQAPVIGANVASADNRLATRASTAADVAKTKLGYQSNMHQTNTQRKMAGQDQMLGGIGMGLSFTGDLAQAAGSAMASDVNAKTDIKEPQTPDESLSDIEDLAVQQWKYKGGGGDHVGAMAQDMPGDMSDGTSVDVPTYLGKLTQSVQALSEKLGRFEKMLNVQGGV